MPPLPSLAEFPEEGDKEVESEHEREKISFKKRQLFPVWDLLAKKRKNENKLFQSPPRDRQKTGDVLLPLWLLWKYF